jgi:uncharacterized membrane protein YfcA
MGGEALMTQFLILMVVRPTVAVGTDLFQMMFTKTFGDWRHNRQETVSYRLVLPLIMGSLPGALLGVRLLVILRDHFSISLEVFLPRLLGDLLTLVGFALLFRILLFRRFSRGKRTWEGM